MITPDLQHGYHSSDRFPANKKEGLMQENIAQGLYKLSLAAKSLGTLIMGNFEHSLPSLLRIPS